MQLYSNNVPDKFGNAIEGVQVLVTQGGVNAALFSDNGVTPMANPTLTNDLGVFEFYAANGTYDITLSSPKLAAPIVYDGVILYDPIDAGATTSLGTDLANKTDITKGSKLIGFFRNLLGFIGRTISDKLAERISPLDFGAVGDGVTDDRAAFVLIAALPAGTRIDGCGLTYMLSAAVSFTNRITLVHAEFKASAAFPLNTFMVTIAGNNSHIDVKIDAAQRANNGVHVSASDCTGFVEGKNIWGVDPGVGGGIQSALYISGNGNRIGVHGYDLLVNTATNPSHPRVLSVAPSSGNNLPYVTGRNAHALFVNQDGKLSIDYLAAENCGPNGIYDISSGGDITIGDAFFTGNYVGTTACQVTVIIGKCQIGNLLIKDVAGCASVDIGGSLQIGDYQIVTTDPTKTYQPMLSRAATTTASVRIGSLSGNIFLADVAAGGGIFQFFAGAIGALSVGRVALDVHWKLGSTKQLLNQTTGTGCYSYIGELSINLIDTTATLTGTDVFTWLYPTFSLPSYLNKASLVSVAASVQIQGMAQANMATPPGIELVLATGNHTSGLTLLGPRLFSGTGVPTAGTFRRGDIVANKFPLTGIIAEWICVTAGTPGTWRMKDFVVSKGTTAQRPAGLTAVDFGAMHMDTTLAANGKPIWWNGTIWVDNTGTAV